MSNRKQMLLRSAASVFAVIAVAFLCRRIVVTTDSRFVEQLANFTRIYLYLGLFAAWGVSVYRRVMQAQVRRYLVAVAVLMVLWLTIREFRWHLVLGADARRWLWYAYYIGILMIPMLALLVSLSLGKGENYRLPEWTSLFYIPTLVLIGLALTNDLHHRLFIFPSGAAMQTELDYRYGAVYYVLTAWAALCALGAFFVMLSKCRIPRTGKFLWLPLLPFGIALGYVVLYALRVPIVTGALGDMAVFDCLLFTAFFECCIQCGLIQSNSRYSDLFRASEGIAAQILDRNDTVHYASHAASAFPREIIEKAEAAPVVLPEGKRLHNRPVNGGRVVWTEDISELLNMREKLEDTREELRDRNEFLRYSYEKEREHRLILEQNRLYDLLQDKTQAQMDLIRQLTEDYRTAGNEAGQRSVLARIVVLGSYIKRRKDFVLSMDSSSVLSENKLSNALDESFRSLELLGIRGGYYVRTGRDYLDGNTLSRAYDFFECVVEHVWDSAHYLNAAVREADGELRCTVTADRNGETAQVRRLFPEMQLLPDEDGGVTCLLPLEGGGTA